MQSACDIAAGRDGEVVVMSAVTLPEQTPLSEGEQYVDRRHEVVDRAMEVPGSDTTPDVPVAVSSASTITRPGRSSTRSNSTIATRC